MNAILEQVNSAGLKFVEFALPMFIQSVVLIVILLLADYALRKKVRAVFRYWIWLLVLVKLVLPTSLSSPMSLGYFFGDRLTYVETTETPAEPQARLAEPVPASVPPFIDLTDIEADRFTPAAPPLVPVTEQLKEPVITSPAAPQAISITPLSWKGAVFLIWLTVVIAMVLLLLQRAIFVRGLVAQAKEAKGVMAGTLESCYSSMSVKRKLGLKISANATSPAVCGLFRPVILIPQNLASSLTAGQLRAVLMHELAHIRRGDLFVNLAQTILQIVYFYNPMLWLANAIIRRIREQAVDEMVLVAMGEKAPQYPQTLVSVAKLAFKRPVLSLRLIGVVESKSALAGRIKHILNRPLPKKAKLGILGLVVVIFIGAILLPMVNSMSGSPGLVIKGVVKDAYTNEPIARAKVSDDGYANEPNWEQIRPDERHEWGAITNSAGEYSFLTWHEHHTIKVEAPGYKPQRRNLYNGHFTFNKKDQEIFDFTLEPEFKPPEMSLKAKPTYATDEPIELYLSWADNGWVQTIDNRAPENKGKWILILRVNGVDYGQGEYPILVPEYITAGVVRQGRHFDAREAYSKGKRIEFPPGRYCVSYVFKDVSAARPDESQKVVRFGDIATNEVEFDVVEGDAVSSSGFAAKLANGVTVELVGVCEHPSEGKQWWRPDGNSLAQAPYESREGQPIENRDEENNRLVEFAVSFAGRNLPYTDVFYQVHGATRTSGGGDVQLTPKGTIKSIACEISKSRDTAEVRLGVAAGQWKTITEYDGGQEGFDGSNDIVFADPIETKRGTTIAVRGEFGWEGARRITAVDKNGNIHTGGWNGRSTGLKTLATTNFYNVKPDQIQKYQLQFRPYEWIGFKNVSLKPNFKSDLQVEGEEAWGEVVEGLRVRWVHPNEPIVRGTAPVLTMEVENVSSKQIIWECSSGFTWGLNVHGVSPANSLTMPKFRVQVGSDASPEYPGGKTGPEPQPTDYYKLEPEGRIRLSCALPWVLPDSGQYTVKGVIWRRRSKTESLEMGCSSLVLNVVNPTSASDKLAYWGAADTLTGLQLGLSFDLQARPYCQGEVISFIAHVRNTGDKIIKLVYFGLLGWGPTIFDSNGEIVSVLTPILGFPVQKQNLSLNPGETQSVGTVFLELQPGPDTRWDDKSVYPRCYLKPGTYRISQKYRFADDPEASWHGELTTGELELTILRKPPDMQVEGKKNKPPVWLALLPRSPIRSVKELYLYFWGSSLVSDRTKIDSFELEIRSAGDNVRMARIDSKSMITVHSSKGEVLQWSMFRDGLRENMIRRIGPLEDGEYLIAIYVNGVRSSNVARFTVDSSFDSRNEPTLQVVPLVPAPGKKLQYFGLRATGPAPQDSELTNMALHFADIIVDGVPRKILARVWSGPVYPLKPGQQHEEILLLHYYKPEIDLSRKHTVKAIVGRYESANVEIGFDRSLELAWDEATPAIKSRPPQPAVLEGRVIGPDGKPGIGYSVRLYADPGRDQFIEYSDKDGKYDFPNVPAGSYKLTCRPGGNSEPALTFEQFQIEAGKTIVQELSLEGKYAFSGKVTYEDGSPAAGVKIVGRWEIGAGKVFCELSVTDENGYYELTSPFELARYISLTIFTADGVPAQGSYQHIGVRGPRTDVDFIVKRREMHAAIWPEKFARMGGKHPDFQPVPVPEGWDYLRLLQALYEHLETQFKARFPDCRVTLKDEVIELSFNTRDYNIIRPGNAERTGLQRGNDWGIGPEPDGLVLTVHFSKTAGQFDRPYIIDRSPWTGFISQVYLPDIKLYLNVDVQYGTGINEKLLTDLCAPTGWLKTIFNNLNERTPERKATAGAVEKGSQLNVQAVSEIDWVIEDYGQTRLLSKKEISDIDNWISIWGNVVKNKGYYLVPDRGLTLKGLIKAAGYNRDKLAESYVELIRRSQEANIPVRSTYSRNLKTLLSGEESDVVIKPHDSIGGGYIEPSANGVEFWSGYHFGDVVQMTVNDDGAKVNMFADLDIGKLVTPPDTLNFDNENAVLRWIKDNGIDVMGETAESVHGLAGFNMYAARVDNYFWDAGPREVTDRLMVRIDDPVLLSVDNLLPVTYLIKTSKYKMGILQILGFAENPKGIKIRYKLLNKEAASKSGVQFKSQPRAHEWERAELEWLQYKKTEMGGSFVLRVKPKQPFRFVVGLRNLKEADGQKVAYGGGIHMCPILTADLYDLSGEVKVIDDRIKIKFRLVNVNEPVPAVWSTDADHLGLNAPVEIVFQEDLRQIAGRYSTLWELRFSKDDSIVEKALCVIRFADQDDENAGLAVPSADEMKELVDPPTKTELQAETISGDWHYIGQSIPPDFNDTMILTEHVNLGSIGHDAEGKTFITLLRDSEKTKGRQYRFVLFNKAGNILEPDGYVALDRGERLEEKFTFDEPFITRQLKGFRFQTRSLPPSGFDNISSILQKVAPEVVKDEILLPSTSNLAPPGLYAVELDGVDDYLLVPDSPSLRLEPPFTIEMWIKTKLPPDASEYRGGWALISKGFCVGTPRAYLTGFGINLQRFPKEPSNLHIDFCKANNSGTYSAMYAGYPLTNGVSDWIHITHVFDGEYYKSTPGHPLVMGKFLIPTNDPFKGLLGEVRLWNGARTRQELRQYENLALTGNEPGLAACWTFEQPEGRYAYDISGNNNHARLGKFTGPDDADPKWIDLQSP